MRSYLLLDDNLAFAENLAEILRDGGDEATVVTEGPRALSLAGARRFDVLLTDMKMPGMNGAQAVRHIRQVDPGLAVVVITAYPGEEELEAVRREGLLAVLPKPVPLAPLVSLLTHARRDGLVALIEGEPARDETLAEQLRSRGFSCVTARSVEDAERLAGARLFAALVPPRRPGEPECEALHWLRTRFPTLPVFSEPVDLQTLLDTLERAHDSR
ncbi:response regulator [Cystobacter fuscus]|uniref:response regulator n=1 Tax=Cystobacter fuscus TaxID=43 RepID=UPI002B309BAA|nr:response regulator [Cystobacter fuscus]